MSFRLKTILGVALIEAFSLTVLLVALIGFMHDSHETQMQRYSRATVANFAAMIQDSLLAMDLARLQSFAHELTGNSSIVYARIIDQDGRELALSGPQQLLQRTFEADESLAQVDDGVLDISSPVVVADYHYGEVEIGIAVDEIQAIFGQTLFWGLSIASAEMLLVALFSLALGTYLTRQLALLKTGAENLASGDLGYQVQVRGSDELAATATAFNLMAQSLRTRTEQLSAIFAISPDGFLSLDSEGRVRLVNPSLCEMLGVEAEALLGKSRRQLEQLLREMSSAQLPFGQIDDVERLMAAQATGNTKPYVFETAHAPKRVLQLTARRGDIADVALLLHFRDISHEREVDLMKSEFLSAAAHELRTPMSSVFGFSEILLNKELGPDQQREILAIIHKQSALLVRIVNELLDLARIEARSGKDLKLQWLSLDELVQVTLAGFEPEQQARFVVQLGEQAAQKLKADPDKMQQALTNLVSNACKYSAEDQQVTVRGVTKSEDGRSWLGIEVVDNGIGMSEFQVQRCFDRFWRADDSGRFPGTGLGMALVKEIVELHRGNVELSSEPGQGTRVTIWLLRQPDSE